MKLFTLFISYSYGLHYCGVYTSLECLHGVIQEMAKDCDIPKREVPKLSLIKEILGDLGADDFWHEFGDGSWIHVQETSEQLVKEIQSAVCEPCPARLLS